MADITINGLTFEPHITRDEIDAQVQRVASEIARDCTTPNPLLLCVLNGAFIFAADLIRALNMPRAEITFIRFKSYEGTSSTGTVKEIMGLNQSIEGREIIIVEDIVDTGITSLQLRKMLLEQKPASVKMATLLFKPESLTQGPPPESVGFSIPSKFIIGYGLDLDEAVRGLPEIYILKENN